MQDLPTLLWMAQQAFFNQFCFRIPKLKTLLTSGSVRIKSDVLFVFPFVNCLSFLLQKLTWHVFLVFLRNLYTLFTVAVPMYFPTTKSIWVCPFLHILPTFVIVVLLMITGMVFLICTSLYFPRSLTQSQTSWNVKSSGSQKASLRTKLVEVMEFQLSYFKS